MNPWIAKAVILAATLAMIVIRVPHGRRSRAVTVASSHRGAVESVLMALSGLGFLVPLIWVASPAFSFAEYPLHAAPLAAGLLCLVAGLWLFYRSHADLGTNWSYTLEVREQHHLVTHGVYRRIRHPMYTALLIYSLGQALVLPNWVAGPSYLITFVTLFAFRVRAEEKMMLEHFGKEYAAYIPRTKRLIPGIW
jgi:protein-S-isoprenylcysteine O-methyltransferase Ste14